MDFWQKARSFADEAKQRTQDLTSKAYRFSDIVSLRAEELRSQAEELRSQAISRAEEFRRFASAISDAPSVTAETETSGNDLRLFGVTEELTEFVQGITPITFRDFPLEDDTQLCDVDTASNVRQDLSEWQERHAALVLSSVKEISKLRYELCPRFMKERKFWRIYFILVNSHVAPYEKRYTDHVTSKAAEVGEVKDESVEEVKEERVKDPPKVELNSKAEVQEENQPSKTSTSRTEQDLDAFLLGDLEESDDGQDDYGSNLDDDFDKMLDGLDDDEKDNL